MLSIDTNHDIGNKIMSDTTTVTAITETQKEQLIESLTNAFIKLAEDGILNYHDIILSADCTTLDEDEGQIFPDMQAVLPLIFEAVEGFEPTHAEICGFISFSNCLIIQVDDGDGGTKDKLIWSNPDNANDVIMNFGYHSNNLTWVNNRDMNDAENYKADDYKDWSEYDEVGITYDQDCEMGYEVANRAVDRMSPALKTKFLNEIVELANRERIAP